MIAWLLAACAPTEPTAAEPPSGPWLVGRDDAPGAVPAPPGARSVVLVVGCTVRADQTAPYGGSAAVTPFLATLAAEGVVVDDAIAAAPWTRPAVTALLTGRHALEVGMVDPGPDGDQRVLPAEVTTLAEHLRGQGWTTIGVSTNPNVHARWGLDQGFDRWRAPAGTWTGEGVKLPAAAALAVLPGLLDAAPPDRPVFLLVVLVDAHAPYEATDAERAALADPTVPAEVVDYRAALRRFDAAAARVVGLARDRLGDPVVAVVSDHGEGLRFPEHHGRGHGRFLAPSAVREVWVAAGPGIPAGRRVPGTVSQIDVAPTLATLAGAAPFAASGVDRAPSLVGGALVAPGVAYADTWFQDVDRAAIYSPTAACQVDLSGAPPADGFVDGCFDRRADPQHATPIPDPGDLVPRLLAFRAAREGVAPAPAAAADPGVDAQLRALGYAR